MGERERADESVPDENADAERGAPAGERLDVIMHGTVFLDIVMTGLPTLPAGGTEIYAAGMGSAPGGVANLAVAASRLGLRTGLAASFGDDVYGDFLWQTLESQEGVDLSLSRRIDGWHSPVTVSMAVHRDRSMVTHAHESPISAAEMLADPPPAAAGVLHMSEEELPWVARARSAGTLLFGDVAWDVTDNWSADALHHLPELSAFLPNDVEAMSYTRTDDARAAMMRLADDVPVVVVTCGAQGAIGLDASTAEEEWVPALPVTAVDPTGAGDVFLAAFVLATLRNWPLRQRMSFANLCAGLSVQQVGGSLAAPGWGDLADWLTGVQAAAREGSRQAAVLARSYGYLTDVLPTGPTREVRRATATIARASDAAPHGSSWDGA